MAGAPEIDRFRWLEDINGPQAQSWVNAANAATFKEYTQGGAFAALEQRLLRILDAADKLPLIAEAGGFLYNFWTDSSHPRGLWRRTTLAEYRRPEPKWQVLLDVGALAAAEGESWVWKGARVQRPDCDRALVSLSRGGGDAIVVREFDLDQRQFVVAGFELPEAKSSVSWQGRDSLLVATDFGPGTLTNSGYPRLVKQWRRGTSLDQATLIYEGQTGDVAVAGHHDSTVGFERDWVERSPTFYTSELFLRVDEQLVKIDTPADASAFSHREWLFVELRSPWLVSRRTYPAGALLVTRLEKFLAGERAFDVLFEPTERSSLAGVSPTRHHVIVNVLDNVVNRLQRWSHDGVRWSCAPLVTPTELCTVAATAVDADTSDDYFLTITGYLNPTSLYLGHELLKASPAYFDGSGLIVTQRHALSADGTKIPYFEICREDLRLDGKTPTLLYGYGGFEVSLTPVYSPLVGHAWLEAGGVYVVANLRGGGEFGPHWHQAALGEHRHKAYEDFEAVAMDLVRRGVTNPAQLGIMGGSNGGLLVANAMTRHPELFGAVVAAVPLADMQRYHHLLAGASWMAEYGNPDEPADWAFLRRFSPYHNVTDAVRYPPALVTSSTRDDRVHPGHARKLAARLAEAGQDVHYYENTEGGHAGSADNRQAAFANALEYTFLWHHLARTAHVR